MDSRILAIMLAALLTASAPSAASLLRAPLTQAPSLAAKHAFVGLALSLESTAAGRARLASNPELSRLAQLNFEGHWGAGTLELLLRQSPQLAYAAAQATRADAGDDEIRRLDAALSKARQAAVPEVRKIAAAVIEDLEKSQYGIDDLWALGLRSDELSGLLAIDESAREPLARVARLRTELGERRARRVGDFLKRGAAALDGSAEDDLVARMGAAVRAAGREVGSPDAAFGIEYLDRRGRLPTNRKRPGEPGGAYYPPQPPIGESPFLDIAPAMAQDQMVASGLWAQGLILHVAARALQEALPNFAAGFLGNAPEVSPASMLGMVLSLSRGLTLETWIRLSRELGAVSANGQETKDALVDRLRHSGLTDNVPENLGKAQSRAAIETLGGLIERLADLVLQHREQRYRQLKGAQGLLTYPSLGL